MSLDITMYFDVDTGGVEHKCEIAEFNITHNLTEMADKCGLYNPMWRPYRLYNIKDEEENKFLYAEAGELYDAIMAGIKNLESDPEKFKKFNPENGWGSYEGLLRVAKRFADACRDYPKAKVEVWR